MDTFDTKASPLSLVHDVGLKFESGTRGRFLQGSTSVGFPLLMVIRVCRLSARL